MATAVCLFDTPKVKGEVLFFQKKDGVLLTSEFTKLPPGEHGYHIHRAGDLRGEGCKLACDHWHKGPSSSHGGPPSSKGPRHTGDLGNISSKKSFYRHFLKGVEIEELFGRSLIVHADADDLGKGSHEDSKTTGHSGARIACSLIGRTQNCELPHKMSGSGRMNYPDEIHVNRDSEEFKFLTKHSELFRGLAESDEEWVLSADMPFAGDRKKWENFVDVFFPELAVRKFFKFNKKGKASVNESRGTEEDLRDLLDYLGVDTPATMMKFAEAQAAKSLNAPGQQNTVPRGRGSATSAAVNASSAAAAGAGAGAEPNNWLNHGNYAENMPHEGTFWEGNNWNGNDYENENQGVRVGYTEEEEDALRRLSAKNAKKYYTNQGGRRRKTRRRSKKLNKKTRKH